MAISLTATNGFFKRSGYIGGIINSILNYQGSTAAASPFTSIGAEYTNLEAQFTSTTAGSDLFDTFFSQVVAPARQKSSTITYLKTFVQNMLLRMANDDTPLKVYTLPYAVQELIKQMATSTTSYLTPATVAASTIAAGAANVSAYQGVSSVTCPYLVGISGTYTGTNAMLLQHVFPETIFFKCTADSYTGGATLYSETFSYTGQAAYQTDPLTWNFTTLYGAAAINGSGCSGSISVCDPAKYQGTGAGLNLLNNGDFVTFTANVPGQWTMVAGVAGTDVIDGTSGYINTGHSLAFTGNSVAGSLKHQFNNAGGTTSALLPNTVYCLGFWAKTTASTSGNLVLKLIDGAGSTVNDNNSVANSLSTAASGIGTTYAFYSTFFRTPSTIPATGIFLSVSMSAAPGVAKTLNISSMAMRAAPQLYSGGPYAAIFPASTGAVLGDVYTMVFTNDYGNGTSIMGFTQLMAWLLDLRLMAAPPPITPAGPPAGSVGFMNLPIVGTTLINNNLIV